MGTPTQRFNVTGLYMLVEEGLLSISTDPEGSGLLLLNYTQKAQHSKAWDAHPELLDCRGTLIWPDGRVYQRGFRKFFNLDERQTLKDLPNVYRAEVSHKLDGSMILLWPDPRTGMPRCSTRGSFVSEQAIAAQALYRERYGNHLPKDAKEYTHIFEYTAPTNRIVVKYDKPELTLIGMVNVETGWEFPYVLVQEAALYNHLPYVQRDYLTSVDQLTTPRDNFEGYVLFWVYEQIRIKVKLAEYLRLHKILTNVTERDIWEALAAGTSLSHLYEAVPEEFAKWATATITSLLAAYSYQEERAKVILALTKKWSPLRKSQALFLKEEFPEYAGVVFKMLDERPYAHLIWRQLRPAATKPFKEEAA